MNIKKHILCSLDSALNYFGLKIIEEQNLYEWQTSSNIEQKYRESKLPDDAAEYLVVNNPRLRELHTRYANFNEEVTTPLVWTDTHVRHEDMLYFRGDNAYIWQTRKMSMNIMAYALTTYYTKSIDRIGIWEKLEEDKYFGIHTFNINNKLVSRDLLDSILEINYLDKHLNISSRPDLSVLDIGAGYGRLAHRMLGSLSNIAQYFCTDAFPVSTFISEYYLRFRNLEGKAKVVPLDEIEHVLSKSTMDLAVNIHSFSECKISAIEWWLRVLAKYRVKNLMVVPNSCDLRTNDGIDFNNIIEKYGYKMISKEPKYEDPIVQKYAINPTYYYLFELI